MSIHLAVGSEKPKMIEGKARLYSMKFCPFAQRIRLVLSLKKIAHDIVNINLKSKPEWFFEIHPEGKVPAFVDSDGKVVVDSTVIANYIDEKYPQPPLYREETKPRDLELLERYDKIIGIFSRSIHGVNNRPLEEIMTEIEDSYGEFENELVSRSSPFFNGDRPGMLDLMIWPWIERLELLPLIFQKSISFSKEKLPYIAKWSAEMREQDFVKENAMSCEETARFFVSFKAGSSDFDNF